MTFRRALLNYRDAALRWSHGIRRLNIHRCHTHLTAVVSETDRKRFESIINVGPSGESALTASFQKAIDDAIDAASTHMRHN